MASAPPQHTLPQAQGGVFIKALPSETCLLRKAPSEMGLERRCGSREPGVPICFLPSDPWLFDFVVMTLD